MGGINTSAVSSVVEDFLAADAAAKKIGANFSLATSGWTLGPAEDRAYFDKVLPPGWTLTSIDETLGDSPVESAYSNVTAHHSWIIPWAEDDPHLGTTQLWVNRTLQHMGREDDDEDLGGDHRALELRQVAQVVRIEEDGVVEACRREEV